LFLAGARPLPDPGKTRFPYPVGGFAAEPRSISQRPHEIQRPPNPEKSERGDGVSSFSVIDARCARMGVKRRRRPRKFRLFDYQLGRRPFKAQERGQHPHRRPLSRRLVGPRPPVVPHRATGRKGGRQARSRDSACRKCSIGSTGEHLVADEGTGARLPDAAPFSRDRFP